MIELQDQRFDPAARAQLRDLSKDYFGCFGLLRLLQSQVDYLDNDGTAAALDSELSLTWWDFYSRSKWLPNLLHYRAREQGLDRHAPPVLMVCRLDAPRVETVRDGIILASLKAERDGLKGKFVIDSRGLLPGAPGGKNQSAGFAAFDQTLRTLANLVRERTDLQLVMDDRDVVFPAEARIDDVALYCGWYSVRKYVPAFEFTPGAVGYHIASFELVSLHTPHEKGWVAGLLNDGVSGTLGPVAEPYLHAFPLPNEFFPLLLTGKLTLAEVYWSTCPLNSWMLSLIGDPLYTPFKNHPEMTLDELPENLRSALKMPPPVSAQPGGPASGPASGPATAPQRAATAPSGR
jgi:uncharacterized protein (TIGR03790 family)